MSLGRIFLWSWTDQVKNPKDTGEDREISLSCLRFVSAAGLEVKNPMARFVCPFCDEAVEYSDEDEVIPEALTHMRDEHDKRKVTAEYVRGNIHAH